MKLSKLTLIVVLPLVIAGCAIAAKQVQQEWDQRYGKSAPKERVVASIAPTDIDYWTDVKPILETRCVACHACYDAACQLKTTAIEGIERGMSKEDVYNQSRLTPADPGRLFEDAQSVEQWRRKGFFPVLNEHTDNPQFNREASLLYRSLELKEANPLPSSGPLSSEEYTFGLGRENVCPTPAQYDDFASQHPQWGMPYALPGLNDSEQAILKGWVEAGGKYTARKPLDSRFDATLASWESFLNQDTPKGQLVSRYLYEHLFLNNLYFPEISNDTFFRIIRSTTPSGQAPNIIATRRPFEDPRVQRVYYRLVPELETIVDKTHNPYRLDENRRDRWESLFFKSDYQVEEIPGYELPDTANPFVTFSAIPVESRYSFLLDEAQATIMNYIKGSVCRGQVAVNVIRDHFWVFFLDPDSAITQTVSTLLPTATEELALANSSGGNSFMPLAQWIAYARLEDKRRDGRDEFMSQYFSENPLTVDEVWDGDHSNPNAALTIYRHLDSATVEKGLLGDIPQTAWFIDYTLLERIHYLLVASYDVYGTLGHQLISRLHMDFLRMEGETNFINFLPISARDEVRNNWYREAPRRTLRHMSNPKYDAMVETGVVFQTDDPRRELIEKMRAHVAPALNDERSLQNLSSPTVITELSRLSGMTGGETRFLPELTIIRIDGAKDEYVTLLKNNAHLNMTSIFRESRRLVPEENTVSLVYGVLGSYPNAFMHVPENRISEYVDSVLAMKNASDYRAIVDDYAIRRTNQDFWKHSDELHAAISELQPVRSGVLDYNRLDNR